MNFKPFGKRVLIQLDDPLKVTEGGIIYPDDARERSSIGEVVAIGPDVKIVAVGNKVVIAKFVGVTIEKQGESEFIIVNEDQMLGGID